MRIRPFCRPDDSIDCCALIHAPRRRLLHLQLDRRVVEIAAPQLNDFGDHVAQIDRRRRTRLLAAEPRQISNDLSRAAGLRFDERDFVEQVVADFGMLLEQLRRAKDRLQRVVQLVRDAGHEQADGRQTLLPHHLPLQRLQRLVRVPLLLDLAVERLVRLTEARRHGRERFLEMGELHVRRRTGGRR